VTEQLNYFNIGTGIETRCENWKALKKSCRKAAGKNINGSDSDAKP
jgi:hypothetical protein